MRTALNHSVNTYLPARRALGAESPARVMDRFSFGSDPRSSPDDQKAASGIFVVGGKPLQAGRRQLRHRSGRDRAGWRGGPDPTDGHPDGGGGGDDRQRRNADEADAHPAGRRPRRPRHRRARSRGPERRRQRGDRIAARPHDDQRRRRGHGLRSAGDLGGTTFAGKTGTAEINIQNDIAQPWFIAFAPVEDPQIAVAVTVERCAGCFGGDRAGPIATAVMNELLSE